MTFTYTYSSSGGIWEGLAVSKIFGYTLPVTSTGKSAFAWNSTIEKVTFPSSLETLGGYTFQECSSLNSVELPEGLETIGDRAFRKWYSIGIKWTGLLWISICILKIYRKE